MDIIDKIKGIYERGEMSYLLLNYVDRDFWSLKLKESFSNIYYIDNLTDFNYNKCFTIYMNLSDNNAGLGSKEFDDYIRNNKNLYLALIEISTLAPYCILKYIKYYKEKEIECECKNTPYCQEHMKFDQEIREFLSKNGLIILDDDILMVEVPNKSLELKEAPVSVYNCLFQDTYCYYPYLENDDK